MQPYEGFYERVNKVEDTGLCKYYVSTGVAYYYSGNVMTGNT